jgi:hypothetical protein
MMVRMISTQALCANLLDIMNEEPDVLPTAEHNSGQENGETMIKRQVPDMVMKTLKLYAQMLDYGNMPMPRVNS